MGRLSQFSNEKHKSYRTWIMKAIGTMQMRNNYTLVWGINVLYALVNGPNLHLSLFLQIH